eukprot:CAMPEP_0204540200 /NCGR_PEP_ID=MMETSP0661-20131031/17308_1 /ASSEMBLY_ACC=CAM_ASM_000606 /TAXON_ID=109239 /ORGANISM="Alexandrium margalefi, Strain AMGDE01CS-322" /LENGTH=91 /DNA_ID=CAMNT_0051546849 /DNA_START=1 /DNA_END=276 /DNA_ORIENTATION=+
MVSTPGAVVQDGAGLQHLAVSIRSLSDAVGHLSLQAQMPAAQISQASAWPNSTLPFFGFAAPYAGEDLAMQGTIPQPLTSAPPGLEPMFGN